MEERRKMNKKVKWIAGVLIALSLVGVVVGAILYQKEVAMKVKIVGAEVELFEDDRVTPKTLIDFGEASPSLTISIGSKVVGERIWLVNVGDKDVSIYWSAPCPIGKIDVRFATSGTADWQNLVNGTHLIVGAEWMMMFNLVIDADVSRGTYDWTLTFLACDASGP